MLKVLNIEFAAVHFIGPIIIKCVPLFSGSVMFLLTLLIYKSLYENYVTSIIYSHLSLD